MVTVVPVVLVVDFGLLVVSVVPVVLLVVSEIYYHIYLSSLRLSHSSSYLTQLLRVNVSIGVCSIKGVLIYFNCLNLIILA